MGQPVGCGIIYVVREPVDILCRFLVERIALQPLLWWVRCASWWFGLWLTETCKRGPMLER